MISGTAGRSQNKLQGGDRMSNSRSSEEYRATLKAIQEAARQTSTVVSLLQAGYIAIISLTNLRAAVEGWSVLLFVLPIPLWIASLILAVQVFMPIMVSEGTSELTKLQKAERDKYRLLRWSRSALFVGLAVMFVNVILYFAFVPASPQRPVVVVTPTATPTETPTVTPSPSPTAASMPTVAVAPTTTQPTPSP